MNARGRDWVVLPPEEPDEVRPRPVDGSEAESVPDAPRPARRLTSDVYAEFILCPLVDTKKSDTHGQWDLRAIDRDACLETPKVFRRLNDVREHLVKKRLYGDHYWRSPR